MWIESTPENIQRVFRALSKFGAPPQVLNDLQGLEPGEVLWMGNPPFRVDILQQVDGVIFEEAFPRRLKVEWDGVPVSILGREDLIASKRAAGRPQDLIDVENLERGNDETFGTTTT